jgi:hypothetical protein
LDRRRHLEGWKVFGGYCSSVPRRHSQTSSIPVSTFSPS